MVKNKKITGKKFKDIIKICQNALKGKTNVEETNLLHILPILRNEIQKGKFNYSSIKAFSLSSQVLNIKTRNLLGDFFHKEADIPSIEEVSKDYIIESAITYPINSFRNYLLENDIIKAYFELLKNRKVKRDYSIARQEVICAQNHNGFKEFDSFENDKNELYNKLIRLNEKTIHFNKLQNNWDEAVINLIYLAHLAQEGKVLLEQKSPNNQIIIRIKN